MPEIHGLSDFRGYEPFSEQAQQGNRDILVQSTTTLLMPDGAFSSPPPLAPKDISIVKVLNPNFQWISVTNVLILIQLIMLAVCLGYNTVWNDVLTVPIEALVKYGAVSPNLLRSGQVWRLFTALVIHINFIHFALNSMAQIYLLHHYEKHYGFIRFAIFYAVCGFGGNLFSVISNENVLSAGASTAIFAFLGLLIGEIIVFWHRITMRYLVACSAGTLVLMTFLLWPLFLGFTGSAAINYFAHGGGILSGLFLTGLITYSEPNKPSWHSIAMYLGLGLWLMLMGISALVLFVVNG